MKLTNTIFQFFSHNGYPQVPFNNIRSTDVEFTAFAHVGPVFFVCNTAPTSQSV